MYTVKTVTFLSCFFLLYMCAVPPTLKPGVLLTPTSTTVDIGSSVTLTCSPSLSDNVSQYNGAKVKFQYRLNGGSVFRDVNIAISEGTVPTDSTQLTIDTSFAGTYTCTVTINGHGISIITGSSASRQSVAQVTIQGKNFFTT